MAFKAEEGLLDCGLALPANGESWLFLAVALTQVGQVSAHYSLHGHLYVLCPMSEQLGLAFSS